MASIRVCDSLDWGNLQTETLDIESLPELKSALKHRGWAKATIHRVDWFLVDPFFEDEVLWANQLVDSLTELQLEELAKLPTQTADQQSGSFMLASCAGRLASD